MSIGIRPGDIIFTREADPVVVKDRDKVTGVFTLDRDQSTVRAVSRHGLINGLSEENRASFNALLDEVKGASQDPAQRIDLLKSRLEHLEKDPKNLSLVEYLRAELNHLIHVYGVKPREFQLDSANIRSY